MDHHVELKRADQASSGRSLLKEIENLVTFFGGPPVVVSGCQLQSCRFSVDNLVKRKGGKEMGSQLLSPQPNSQCLCGWE